MSKNQSNPSKIEAEQLPADIYEHHILPKLSLHDICLRAQFVCKLWKQNAFKSIKVLDFAAENKYAGLRTLHITDLCERARKNQNFTAKLIQSIPPESIQEIIVRAPISPLIPAEAFEQALEFLCARFPAMREIDLSVDYRKKVQIIDVDHHMMKLKNLEEFRFKGSEALFSDAAWERLAPLISHADIEKISEKRFFQLKNVVSLSMGSAEFGWKSALRHLRKLERLQCGGSYQPAADIMQDLKLQYLSFFAYTGDAPFLAPISQTLRHLTISGVRFVDKAAITTLPNLYSLSIRDCTPILLQALESSICTLRHLEIFGIMGWPGYYTLPESYWQNMQNLMTLSLGNIALESVKEIPFHRVAPRLDRFEFYSYSSMPKNLAKGLRKARFIRSLTLSIRAPMTGEFDWLAESVFAPHLESLSILNFEQPLSEDILHAISKCQSLLSLEIRGEEQHYVPQKTPMGIIPVKMFAELISSKKLPILRQLIIMHALHSKQTKEIEKLEKDLKCTLDVVSMWSQHDDADVANDEDDEW